MRMGLREANQSFSKAMKAVKQGKEVVLTERGKPIAVIKPLETKEDQKAIILRLRRRGCCVRLASEAPCQSQPGKRFVLRANRCRRRSARSATSGDVPPILIPAL